MGIAVGFQVKLLVKFSFSCVLSFVRGVNSYSLAVIGELVNYYSKICDFSLQFGVK